MSTIDNETVKKVAHLARIAVSEEEVKQYASDLQKIMTVVEKINEVNTDDIEPMAHPQDVSQRLREDTIVHTNERDTLMQNAPSQEQHLFLVPKMIDAE